ncbi:hypothetical protein FQR65_LT18062 [Abscondita terminalis]|nr:hypothetical protein FQR65_LT18062 [Abscondita terminalis]
MESAKKTKDKIQYFYAIRSLLPEFFENRDPFLPEIQNLLTKGLFLPLPKTKTLVGPTICLLRISTIPEEMNLNIICKYFFMLHDILLNEDDKFVIAGMVLLIDYTDVPLKLLTQVTPVTSNNTQLVYDKVDKDLFPVEYGGKNGSLEELSRQWKMKVESYKNWFLEDSKNVSNQKIRIDTMPPLCRRRAEAHTRSNTAAIPWPPPMHMVSRP